MSDYRVYSENAQSHHYSRVDTYPSEAKAQAAAAFETDLPGFVHVRVYAPDGEVIRDDYAGDYVHGKRSLDGPDILD